MYNYDSEVYYKNEEPGSHLKSLKGDIDAFPEADCLVDPP